MRCRDGREKKDKQDGRDTHPNNAPIIKYVKLVGGVFCPGFSFHLSYCEKNRRSWHYLTTEQILTT